MNLLFCCCCCCLFVCFLIATSWIANITPRWGASWVWLQLNQVFLCFPLCNALLSVLWPEKLQPRCSAVRYSDEYVIPESLKDIKNSSELHPPTLLQNLSFLPQVSGSISSYISCHFIISAWVWKNHSLDFLSFKMKWMQHFKLLFHWN